MSGVLHPEGPEAAQTYWLRRVLVVLALMILVLVGVGVAGASMGATRQAAPPPVAAANPGDSPSPTPTASSPSQSTPSASSSTSPSPAASASAPSSGRAASATVTPDCARKDLKASLTGKQMLKLSRPAAFTVTVRNDGDETCRVSLTRNDFELKVSGGKKLLWSSKACSTATFVVAAKLDLDQTMSWSMLWDGRGTAAGCVQPGAELKRGTYLATATVAGAKAAELPVTLRP